MDDRLQVEQRGLEKSIDYNEVEVPGLRGHQGELADRFYDAPSRSVQLVGVTGTTVYVDNGYHAMGMAVTSIKAPYEALEESLRGGS